MERVKLFLPFFVGGRLRRDGGQQIGLDGSGACFAVGKVGVLEIQVHHSAFILSSSH
jgi:hypothetical protein